MYIGWPTCHTFSNHSTVNIIIMIMHKGACQDFATTTFTIVTEQNTKYFRQSVISTCWNKIK